MWGSTPHMATKSDNEMKQTIRHRRIILLLTAGLLTGCTDSDDGNKVRPPVAEININAINIGSNATRASVVNDDAGLKTLDLHVDAYYHDTATPYFSNKKVHFNASAWGFVDGSGNAEHYYWPIVGSVPTSMATSSLDFVAYAPYDLTGTGVSVLPYNVSDGLSFSCALPADQTALKEFLYAHQQSQTSESNSGSVNLDFQHPFAKIAIQVKPSHREIYSLNTIKFKNVKNHGTFTHGNSPQWETSGENTDLTITLDQAVSEDADFTTSQVTDMHLPFIVIPQTYTAAGQIEVKLTWGSGDAEQTYTFNNPVSEWESGKSYTYTLDLLGKIEFSVTINSWSAEGADRTLRFYY